MNDGSHEHSTYQEAKNPFEFTNQCGGMCIEFSNMEHRQVWELTPKPCIPAGQKLGKQT
jgi:hypothetical protein